MNKINGQIYIGQTKNFDKRMIKYERLYCKEQPRIFNAIKKYGWDNFDKFILEQNLTTDEANVFEKFYIDKFQTVLYGYNMRDGGFGHELSTETLRKMSKSHKGRRHHYFGKTRSNTTKEKISTTLKNRKLKKETIDKIKKSRHKKSIICVNDGTIYESLSQAAEKLGLSVGNICFHLKNPLKCSHLKGYIFKYVK